MYDLLAVAVLLIDVLHQPRDDVNARTVVFMLPYTNPISAYHQQATAFRRFSWKAHCTHRITSTQPHTDVNAA